MHIAQELKKTNAFGKWTCPHCLTVIEWFADEHEIVASDRCSRHLAACRDHLQSNAVLHALAPLTDKKDDHGRPVYAIPGLRRS